MEGAVPNPVLDGCVQRFLNIVKDEADMENPSALVSGILHTLSYACQAVTPDLLPKEVSPAFFVALAKNPDFAETATEIIRAANAHFEKVKPFYETTAPPKKPAFATAQRDVPAMVQPAFAANRVAATGVFADNLADAKGALGLVSVLSKVASLQGFDVEFLATLLMAVELFKKLKAVIDAEGVVAGILWLRNNPLEIVTLFSILVQLFAAGMFAGDGGGYLGFWRVTMPVVQSLMHVFPPSNSYRLANPPAQAILKLMRDASTGSDPLSQMSNTPSMLYERFGMTLGKDKNPGIWKALLKAAGGDATIKWITKIVENQQYYEHLERANEVASMLVCAIALLRVYPYLREARRGGGGGGPGGGGPGPGPGPGPNALTTINNNNFNILVNMQLQLPPNFGGGGGGGPPPPGGGGPPPPRRGGPRRPAKSPVRDKRTLRPLMGPGLKCSVVDEVFARLELKKSGGGGW